MRQQKYDDNMFAKFKFTDYDATNQTVKFNYDNGAYVGTLKKVNGKWIDQ